MTGWMPADHTLPTRSPFHRTGPLSYICNQKPPSVKAGQVHGMKLRPFQVPDCRVTGVSPPRLAPWGPVMVPNSGMWVIRPAAVMLEMPRIELRISDRRSRVSSHCEGAS